MTMATGRKKLRHTKKPSADAHRQVVELLELGERSSNPDIRAAAIEIAKSTSADQRARAARLAPATIMAAGALVLAAAVALCWYALTHYAEPVAYSITAIVILLAVLLVAFFAVLSGHLSQDNFVKLCIAAWDKVRGLFSQAHPGTVEGIRCEASMEKPSTGEDSPTGP